MRSTYIGILITTALLAAAVLAAPASAGQPSLTQARHQLREAKQRQQTARREARDAAANLAGARQLAAALAAGATLPAPPAGMSAELAARLLADGTVTPEEIAPLQQRADARARLAARATERVRQLAGLVRRLARIETWNRRGQWRPLIDLAAHTYHVSAAGLYHMMMLESGGQRTADSGPYHGLFQFMDSEWARSWNEWRDHSIYDGWSQIQLAAKCISRGMGPSIWPLTYRMSF